MLSFLNQPLRRVPPWTIYVASAAWCAWLFYLAAAGRMGPEPIKALEHAYGIYALKLIVAILLITPLRKWTGLNLLRFRRAIGVSARNAELDAEGIEREFQSLTSSSRDDE